MLDAYLDNLIEHSLECLQLLDEISLLASKGVLTKIEQSAAERQLQVLTEAAIGIAKHWVKQQQGSVPADAYSSFEKLSQLGLLTAEELSQWRKIIGLRNALVHDYLSFSRDVLQRVLTQRHYQQVFDFIGQAAQALRSEP